VIQCVSYSLHIRTIFRQYQCTRGWSWKAFRERGLITNKRTCCNSMTKIRNHRIRERSFILLLHGCFLRCLLKVRLPKVCQVGHPYCVTSTVDGELVQWYCQDELKYSDKNVSQCHLVRHKSHIDWPRIGPGSWHWGTGHWPPEPWRWCVWVTCSFNDIRQYGKDFLATEVYQFKQQAFGDMQRKRWGKHVFIVTPYQLRGPSRSV